MGSLGESMSDVLEKNITEETITFSQDDYQIISQIHDMAEILDKQYDGDSITIRFRMNRLHADRLRKALARKNSH
jgi:50S ribosomal subunit-associated GTPase HflX